MIGRSLAFIIAGLVLPLSAAPAQPAPPAPDPAAVDLARLLMTRDESLYGDADLVRFQARIEHDLAGLDGGCDPFNSDCRGAATIVAREHAPAVRQSERERTERITAYLLADSLRPDEMARLVVYLRGDEGGRFLDALALLRQPDRTEQRRRELRRIVERTTPDALVAARARFRQRTRNLPRALPR